MIEKTIIVPQPHTYKEWQAFYRGSIRTIVNWKALEKSKPSIERLWITRESPVRVHVPWFKGDLAWMGTNAPRKARPGRENIVLLAPAVKLGKERILLLDGCHRMTELGPAVLVADCLVVTKEARRAFGDLLGGWCS